MNKQNEINKIKQAKKNGEVYISSEIISPNSMEQLFLKALQNVLNEDKENK
tara:strand:+ start:332 stop:484 length:153 start_codon:yes stop_codon:yes gene_type:complete